MRLKSVSALFFGVIITFLATGLPWAANLDIYVYDQLLGWSTPVKSAQGVVVIGVDDRSLERFDEPLVLWHKRLARVINGVSSNGATAIALDIIPRISLDKLAPEMDRELIKAVRGQKKNGPPVYLGFMAGEHGQTPHRKFLLSASGLGFLNLFPGKDGKIRRQTLKLKSSTGREAESIALLLARSGGRALPKAPDKIYIDYRMIPPPSTISFADVHEWASQGDNELLRDVFGGKAVIIGVTSPKMPDMHLVPSGLYFKQGERAPGPLIHAITARTLQSGKYMRDAPVWIVYSAAAILAIVSGAMFLALSPSVAVVLAAAMLVGVAVGIKSAFAAFWVVPASPLVLASLIPGAVTGSYRYAMEYRQFRTLQRYFRSYVNPLVMKDIIERPGSVSFDGETVTATIMFTDIRNFTTLSEQMTPKDVLAGLNRYFTEMTKAVNEVDGYLNRYLGDGILAIFGAPKRLPDNGAMAAVKCGFRMLELLGELNKSGLFPGAGPVRIGIGVHTGEAIVGNVGCDEKMDYSIVGDTVNLASRIESQTKELGEALLISDSTYQLVKDRIGAEFVASVKVKGREHEVKLYKVVSITGD